MTHSAQIELRASLSKETAVLNSELFKDYFNELLKLSLNETSLISSFNSYSDCLCHYFSIIFALFQILESQSLAVQSLIQSYQCLSQQLNWASLDIINFIALKASFLIQQKVQRRTISENLNDYFSYLELWIWVFSIQIQLENLILSEMIKLQVLQLLYIYRHLNETDLNSLPFTDLIIHWVWLISDISVYSAGSQICWSPHKEWWLRKIMQNSIQEEIYKQIQHINNQLSA